MKLATMLNSRANDRHGWVFRLFFIAVDDAAYCQWVFNLLFAVVLNFLLNIAVPVYSAFSSMFVSGKN